MKTKYFLTLMYLLPSTLCHTTFGMKTTNNHEFVTPVTNPTSVAFMQDNIIAIAGHNSFALHNNTIKKTVFKEIAPDVIHDITVNTKKNQLALSSTNNLVIYNVEANTLKWKNTNNTIEPVSIAFDSQDDNQIITFFPSFKVLQLSNDPENKLIPTSIANETTNISLCCNPKQPLFSHAFSEQKLTIINYKTLTQKKSPGYFNIIGTDYSPDGKLLAIMNRDDENLVSSLFLETDDFAEENTYKYDSNKLYISMTFHPNNQALALLTDDNKIHYLNYHTDTLIKDFEATNEEPLKLNHSLEKRLSFSPDGKQLLVALKKKCLMLPIPFDIRYEPGTQKKLLAIFCLLKKYTDIDLPSDIINVITEKLLELHEYPLIS